MKGKKQTSEGGKAAGKAATKSVVKEYMGRGPKGEPLYKTVEGTSRSRIRRLHEQLKKR